MNAKKQEIRYTISQIADELDISPRTICFYEEKGLVKPKRTSGNQRVYNQRNKTRLKLILRGKRFGFSINEIAEMIGLPDTDIKEIEQIEKSLKYSDVKLKEIVERKRELILLEKDLLATRKILVLWLFQPFLLTVFFSGSFA